MKKVYFAPETTQTNVEVESHLLDLSNQGNGDWTQGPVGTGDPEPPVDDEGRAKSFSVWD